MRKEGRSPPFTSHLSPALLRTTCLELTNAAIAEEHRAAEEQHERERSGAARELGNLARVAARGVGDALEREVVLLEQGDRRAEGQRCHDRVEAESELAVRDAGPLRLERREADRATAVDRDLALLEVARAE